MLLSTIIIIVVTVLIMKISIVVTSMWGDRVMKQPILMHDMWSDQSTRTFSIKITCTKLNDPHLKHITYKHTASRYIGMSINI